LVGGRAENFTGWSIAQIIEAHFVIIPIAARDVSRAMFVATMVLSSKCRPLRLRSGDHNNEKQVSMPPSETPQWFTC